MLWTKLAYAPAVYTVAFTKTTKHALTVYHLKMLPKQLAIMDNETMHTTVISRHHTSASGKCNSDNIKVQC